MPPPLSEHQGGTLSVAAATFLIDHVFLPPKLPQEDDFQSSLEQTLIKTTVDGVAAFSACLNGEHNSSQVNTAHAMLRNLAKVHPSEFLYEGQLRTALSALKDGQDSCAMTYMLSLTYLGHSIPLHIRAQNAGLLVSIENDYVRFDMFELLPPNEAVMSAQGRLRRTFPGTAVIIPIKTFRAIEFQESIARVLAALAQQAVVGMQPKAKKAGSMLDEDR